ncbi:DUF523 and DUF1722 domain-containing protein [Gottschalkiaceae bacterium SANA]|nr:DUF523 and DUF1722 domain-containing protein [Gottschalkiaceae bacterium SANA]
MKRKPVIFVSKCLEQEACRYDGSMISNAFVKTLVEYVDFITVCPEKEIGLPVPREALRIVHHLDEDRLMFSKSGKDVSHDMVEFANAFLNPLVSKGIHGAILKGRSPSCGIKGVKSYQNFGKSPPTGTMTAGFFGKVFTEKFQGLAIEDEGRLRNYNIREHFLTRIFTMASFDIVKEEKTMKSLIDFHSDNKYLLMAYHQKNQKMLGKIVANHEKKDIDKVINEYEEGLQKALATPMRRTTNINMLFHLLGYFKEKIAKEEKAYFLDLLEQYSTKKVPFSLPLSLIGAWVVRFDEPYLKRQTIFKPYPRGILEVTDSGKGID